MKKVLNAIPFYEEENIALYLGNSIDLLGKMKCNSIDMIFADPPYFLSNGGISCQSGKQVSVDKGEWDKALSYNEKSIFTKKWIRRCYRVLKDNGTIWVSGTFHNIYMIGYYLEKEGFKILNNITWEKSNPPPNLACRCFTHSTETILWAKKNTKNANHTFNYSLMKEMNNGKQMKDVWNGSITSQKEKKLGKHPTQKPLYLLDRIVLASTNEGDIILDPFCGSGTTGVSAKQNGRLFIGIDNNLSYIELSKKRISEIL